MITSSGSRRAASAACILPSPSAREINAGRSLPNGCGRSVSSIVKAATPARSSSTTVRATDSALP